MNRKRLPTRYPLQRFLMLSLLIVVAVITHTLLTDPHLTRALIEAEGRDASTLSHRPSPTASVVSPDVGFTSDTLLGLQIRAAARRLNVGGSIRLESFGKFISGNVPIVASWTKRGEKGQSEIISGCEGTRNDCAVTGERPGAIKVTASAEGLQDTAVLVVTGPDGNVFRDAVPAWASDAVNRLFDSGILQGYDDGRFGAADTLTHGQVITLLSRLLGEAGVAHSVMCTPPFAADHYAVAAYCQFAAKGWLDNTAKTFSPDQTASRGETAAYLRRIFTEAAVAARIGSQAIVPAAAVFRDVPVKHLAFKDTAIAHALGLMTGHPDGRFGVSELLNRAEAAVLIDRARALLNM